jgi:hypothetical protein
VCSQKATRDEATRNEKDNNEEDNNKGLSRKKGSAALFLIKRLCITYIVETKQPAILYLAGMQNSFASMLLIQIIRSTTWMSPSTP